MRIFSAAAVRFLSVDSGQPEIHNELANRLDKDTLNTDIGYGISVSSLTEEHVEQEEQLLLAEVGDGHFVFVVFGLRSLSLVF